MHEPHQTNPMETNTERSETFVIVGSGIAALRAAEEIRKLLPQAALVMIGEENALPYYRPALSKKLLLPQAGERFSLHPPEWYSKRGIFLLSGRRVTRVLPRAKQLELSNGEVLCYDKCILATGAESILPNMEGHSLPGTFVLRALTDYEKIAHHVRPDMRATVIGGGALGLEAAWQLYLGGCHVTVLEAAEQLFRGRLPKNLSDKIIHIASERGIEIRTDTTVSRLEGNGRVEKVILLGEYLNTDLVLFCCGSRPRIELAQEAGLDTARGILVNSRMMTGKYGIYACGDCAQIGRDICGMWSTAETMGRCAGRNAAGEDTLYHPCPTPLWMDACNTRLFAVGDCGTGDKSYSVEHQATEGGESYLYSADGKLCGAVLLGDTRQASALLRAIESGKLPNTV